jgi:hypothetical protein
MLALPIYMMVNGVRAAAAGTVPSKLIDTGLVGRGTGRLRAVGLVCTSVYVAVAIPSAAYGSLQQNSKKFGVEEYEVHIDASKRLGIVRDGTRITQVMKTSKDGQAMALGVRTGDRLIAVDGTEVNDHIPASQLVSMLVSSDLHASSQRILSFSRKQGRISSHERSPVVSTANVTGNIGWRAPLLSPSESDQFCADVRSWQLLSTCVIGPVCEEAIFRTILFHRLLLAGMTFWPAALVSSLAFGAIHAGQGQQVMLAATCHGTFYAYIHYCFCGVSSIAPATAAAAAAVIGLHSLNNAAIILPHAPGWEKQMKWLW